ncbi:hypothetical protein [Arthrobacter sp. Leaf141]|uniref:hypothetical protein n=1 Tax=Arthrobacter sp. Leaf141 TaxID=1736273 RepID=UPI0009E9364F|nr:hypothetical protein [Arthrobacter sp. Leaf141]
MGESPARRRSAARKPIYVETCVRADMERIWELSQDPGLHPRWDLRFSGIVPEAADPDGRLRFRYEFRLPMHTIRGTGISLGSRHRADGQATSVLRFTTADVLSPIGEGSGYWRYIPTEEGVRFVTGYNYSPGMGRIGTIFDAHLIRPALGWATALSFDRLRLWAESGIEPERARNRWIMDAAARTCAVAGGLEMFRRAVGRRRGSWALISGAALLAAFLVPPHWTVPRASRCLRQAPDHHSGRAPSALSDLPSPSAADS